MKTLTITCPRCEQSYPPSGFYWHNGERQSKCRICHNEYVKRWQRENPSAVQGIKQRYRKTHIDRTARERWLRFKERRRERGNRAALQRSVWGLGTREVNRPDAPEGV